MGYKILRNVLVRTYLEEMVFPMPTPAAERAITAIGGQKKDAMAATEATAKLPLAAFALSVIIADYFLWTGSVCTSEDELLYFCAVLRLDFTTLIWPGISSISF